MGHPISAPSRDGCHTDRSLRCTSLMVWAEICGPSPNAGALGSRLGSAASGKNTSNTCQWGNWTVSFTSVQVSHPQSNFSELGSNSSPSGKLVDQWLMLTSTASPSPRSSKRSASSASVLTPTRKLMRCCSWKDPGTGTSYHIDGSMALAPAKGFRILGPSPGMSPPGAFNDQHSWKCAPTVVRTKSLPWSPEKMMALSARSMPSEKCETALLKYNLRPFKSTCKTPLPRGGGRPVGEAAGSLPDLSGRSGLMSLAAEYWKLKCSTSGARTLSVGSAGVGTTGKSASSSGATTTRRDNISDIGADIRPTEPAASANFTSACAAGKKPRFRRMKISIPITECSDGLHGRLYKRQSVWTRKEKYAQPGRFTQAS
mmetsp:Transcript_31484/g.92150  ORF Transcript_31484/g.92150 Transcript_31484/m.92150 type:complete len:372 (-) Transcript_31484:2592-3707(-)